MAATYEPIASVTLASDALYIEFTSIPGTYDDLVIVHELRSKNTGTSVNGGEMRFNADAGSNYSWTVVLGNGSSTLSTRLTNVTSARYSIYVPQVSVATRGMGRIHLMSYADTNVYKTALCESSHASFGVARSVTLWRDTSAINSVRLARDFSTNLEAGSSAALYGIKAA